VTNTDTYIDEMLYALNANINYLQKDGSSRVRIKNGELATIIAGSRYLYQFDLDFFQKIEEDSDVEVIVGKSASPGTIVSVNDKTVQIEMEINHGASIAEATLVFSSYRLLQQLKEKIESIKNHEMKLTNLANKTFGLKECHTGIDQDYKIPIQKDILEEHQEKALRLALGSDVSYIWGPPGTGKTFTIAMIVEALLSKGLSVLLISHTNKATDGALEKVVERIENSIEASNDYHEGKIIRIGEVLPGLGQ
jgi:hypothetical protein